MFSLFSISVLFLFSLPLGLARRVFRVDCLGGMVVMLSAVVLVVGCSSNSRQASGRLDTPEHHVLRGNDAIAVGNFERAEREFELSLGLKEDYAPALAGLAVVKAQVGTKPLLSKRQRERYFEQSKDYLKKAFDKARGPENLEVYLAAIQVSRINKEKRWIKNAESQYFKALKLSGDKNEARPHLYMARVWRDAFQLPKAEELYRRVLGQDSPLNEVADAELAVVQKIRRAAPGSRYGKLIAFDDRITRADIAALFISELRLERIYRRGAKAAEFKPSTSSAGIYSVPKDVLEHPLRGDIEEVIRLGVRGLEVSPRGRFLPDEVINRAEFALMVEDILVKVTGEYDLSTRFVGQKSPFADVKSDLPYFNAVQTVTSRSLMEPKDKINGIFAPLDRVIPVDALIVLRLLKNELRSYVR